MWRVFLSFATHRIVLFAVALLAINAGLNSTQKTGKLLQPFSALTAQFNSRISAVPDIRAIENLRPKPFVAAFKENKNPFHWLGYVLSRFLGFSPLVAGYLLSNLFFLLFLFEVYRMLNLVVTTDISRSALYCMVFWPTSYEMSIGSSVSLTCFLTASALRQAVQQRWFSVGIACAFLSFTEDWLIALVPLLALLFIYIQRHFQMRMVIVQLLGFVVPLLLVQFYMHGTNLFSSSAFHGSALASIISILQHPLLVNGVMAVQLFCVGLFLLGAVNCLWLHSDWFHRLAPLWLLLCLLCFLPLDTIASKLLIAALCLEGITSLSSSSVNGMLQLGMWSWGAWEIYTIFR